MSRSCPWEWPSPLAESNSVQHADWQNRKSLLSIQNWNSNPNQKKLPVRRASRGLPRIHSAPRAFPDHQVSNGEDFATENAFLAGRQWKRPWVSSGQKRFPDRRSMRIVNQPSLAESGLY